MSDGVSSTTRCARRSAATAARSPACAPTTSPRTSCARWWRARPSSTRRAIDDVDVRRRQPGGRGQPQRRADGVAARRAADERARARRSTGCAAPRWTPRCRRAARSRPATRRSCSSAASSRCRARRGAAQAREARSRTGDQTLHSTTLGWRMVNPRMPEQWTISLGASTEKLAGIHGIGARGAGRVRGAQPPADGARRGTTASTTTGSSRCPDTELDARRERAPRHVGREAREAQAGVREGRAPSPPATRPRSTTAPARCSSATRRPASALGREPLARIAGRGTHAVDPDVFGIAPGRGGQPGARARGHRLGRRRGRRAQRGVRRPVARVPGRVARARPRARQRQRRRDRDRAPARRLRRAHPRRRSPTSCAAAAAATASRRSASASARDSRWCCMREPALDFPDYTVDGAAAPQGAARLPARAGDGDDRAAARPPAPGRRSRTTSRRAGPVGERITVTGRAARRGRAPDPRLARRDLAGQRRRPLPAPLGHAGRRRWTRTSAAAGAR